MGLSPPSPSSPSRPAGDRGARALILGTSASAPALPAELPQLAMKPVPPSETPGSPVPPLCPPSPASSLGQLCLGRRSLSSSRSTAYSSKPNPASPQSRSSYTSAMRSSVSGRSNFEMEQVYRAKAMKELRSSVRVVVASMPGFKPSAISEGTRVGTTEETHQVYRFYRRILRWGEENWKLGGHAHPQVAFEEDEVDPLAASVDELPLPPSAHPELPTISWSTLLAWIEQEHDFTINARYKSACAMMMRSLKVWRKPTASPARSSRGVSVSMLFQWVWPSATCDDVADFFSRLCVLELQQESERTPRVIGPEERRVLERIFRIMDEDGRGYLLPLNVCGGDNPDAYTKMLTTTDEATVMAVFGRGRIDLDRFLEMMCEDSFRGHGAASHANLGGGRRIARQSREAVGFQGWMLEEPVQSEARRLRQQHIGALEAEVLRWRAMATATEPRALRCA